jgi:hypothetical protein
MSKYKVRLVARGFSQKPGTDYEETFSPVVRGESIRMLLSLAAQEGMELHLLNVALPSSMVHFRRRYTWISRRDIIMAGVPGVLTIYGLKQSPCCWNQALDDLSEEDSSRCPVHAHILRFIWKLVFGCVRG